MVKKRLMSQTLLAGMLSMALVGQPLLAGKAFAVGGDFSLDFTASAPETYDHLTGGGAYDDGKLKDVVESLEGGDFACDDFVTFLTQIVVAPGAVNQTIELKYDWTADSTGQSGAAFNEFQAFGMNYLTVFPATEIDGEGTPSG